MNILIRVGRSSWTEERDTENGEQDLEATEIPSYLGLLLMLRPCCIIALFPGHPVLWIQALQLFVTKLLVITLIAFQTL